MNDVSETDQQIQLALESSVLNAEQNKVLTKSILESLFVCFSLGFENGYRKNSIETNGGSAKILYVLRSFVLSFCSCENQWLYLSSVH
jgi:hypothetical protein